VKSKRQTPLILVLIADLLMIAVILCTFACFHHVIPMTRSRRQAEAAIAQAAAEAASATPTPAPVETPLPEEEPETIVEDTRTEWQKRFSEHFTDEVVVTDHSYTSPNVSVTVTKTETYLEGYGYGTWPCVYYVADIYVGSLENLRSYTANNRLDHAMKQSMSEMDAGANSVISVNGDFFSLYSTGFYVRNGEIYADNSTYNSVCVLFNDGTMETYKSNSYNPQELEERGVWQAWSFGPELLDSEGHAITSAFSTTSTVNQQNPRCAVGYYEPGHYCYVVVDGRSSESKGMILWMLADLMEQLGCSRAYNLDGGGSAMMVFNHELISVPSNNDRSLSDILCVVDTDSIVSGPNK